METGVYYFAYGSNLSRRQMQARCPDSRPRCRAVLPGYKRVFKGRSGKWRGGVATIEQSPSDEVKGAVYEISEGDLRRLDKCEGYPGVYDRVHVRVEKEDGDFLEAITYVKLDQSGEIPPSQAYLAVIQQGYSDWGIA